MQGHLGGGGLGGHVGAGAGLRGVEDPGVRAVRALVRVHEPLVARRGRQVEDRGQRLVFDLDRVERVDGAVPVTGHDDRDRLAVVAHEPVGDRRPDRVDDVLGDRPGARQAALDVGDVRRR